MITDRSTPCYWYTVFTFLLQRVRLLMFVLKHTAEADGNVLRGTWMWEPNFTAIHSTDVDTFHLKTTNVNLRVALKEESSAERNTKTEASLFISCIPFDLMLCLFVPRLHGLCSTFSHTTHTHTHSRKQMDYSSLVLMISVKWHQMVQSIDRAAEIKMRNGRAIKQWVTIHQGNGSTMIRMRPEPLSPLLSVLAEN